MASVLLLGLVAFVSTNLDDLVLLIALWSDPKSKSSHIVIGQCVGTLLLFGIALLCARMVMAVPDRWLGIVGILPIAVGIKRLWTRDQTEEAENTSLRWGWIPITLLTLANGADNVAVYSSMLVGRTWSNIAVLTGLFFVLTLIWCEITRRIGTHPRIVAFVERKGAVLVPWILIAIGLYILAFKSIPVLVGART